MKIHLKITTGVAAALLATACTDADDVNWTTDKDTAICTNGQGRRVADSYCERASNNGNSFLWYYLGRNAPLPYYGEGVMGGSYTGMHGARYTRAPTGSAMSRSTAIARGGFGSSAHGHAGAGE